MKTWTLTFFVKSAKEWVTRSEWGRTESAAKKTVYGIYGRDNVLFPEDKVVFA